MFCDLTGHTEFIYSVAFSPDSKYLASCSLDKTIKIWSFESQKLITTLQGHKLYISLLAFSPNSKSLVTVSLDMMLKIWNV
jgi:WD40 repeat protein